MTTIARSAVLIFLCIASAAAANMPPVAKLAITQGQQSGPSPLIVGFSSASSHDDDGAIVSVAWDFGDGFTSTDPNPLHKFTAVGTYVVILTVTDNEGATGTSNVTVTVTPPNAPPTVAIDAPSSGARLSPAPADVAIEASATDSDGTVSSVDFFQNGNFLGTDPEAPYSFVWNDAPAGSYQLTAVATDDAGAATTSAPVSISIGNLPPRADISASPLSGTAPLTVSFSSARSTDDGSIVSRTWDFGDGSNDSGVTVSHAFSAAGSYMVMLTVTDDEGATGSTRVIINVTAPGTGLAGEYFNNPDFTERALTRVDDTLDFDWGTGSPESAIDVDFFSVRWSGQVQAQFSETYTFSTISDDGIRVWVNGQLLINNWTVHAATEDSGSIALIAGQKYDLIVEYFENFGDASAKISWSSPSTAKQIIPRSQLYPATITEPPPPPVGDGTGLAGEYFDNTDFSERALTRVDDALNFDWGTGSPDPSIGIDFFSARWSGQVLAQFSEMYTFSTISDDGIRVWINGQLLINNWTVHAATEDSGSIALVAGQKYDLIVEYFENFGDASAKLSWRSPSTAKQIVPRSQLFPATITDPPPPPVGDGTGLAGEYFDNPDFTEPALTRVDDALNFDWGTGSPDPAIGADTFSVRWSGQVLAQFSETYTFSTISDDGIRLWVDSQLLINNWTVHPATEDSGSITLVAGQKYDLIVEYFENFGDASAKLSWQSPSTRKQIIPRSQLFPATITEPPPPPIGDGTGLAGEYFDNGDFTNSVLQRVDETLNFDWGTGSPDPAVGADTFSVRWSGQVQAQFTETYTFSTISDDGIRVWVDGQPLINNWTVHAATEDSGSITLVAGQKYDVTVEYFENLGHTSAKLSWRSPSTRKQIVPRSQLYPAMATAPAMPSGNG